MVYVTRVTKKGQTSIPQEFREEAGIEGGDEVVWVREGHGFRMEPKNLIKHPVQELKKLSIKTKKSALQLKKEAEEEFW